MSGDKNYSPEKDLVGRVMSLEQRIKGLQGRIAAIEACLSGPGAAHHIRPQVPVDDFIPAPLHDDQPEPAQPSVPVAPQSSAIVTLSSESIARRQPARPTIDTTGIIAGTILIGAGLLLYGGNIETIKNPLVAVGCGILLLGSVLVRLLYK